MAKPRVIVSTDIGGLDPDDMESMAHLLVNADELNIKALISTPTGMGGRASDIHTALDAYAKDYAKLDTWGDYPSPTALKSVVYQGALSVPGSQGYASATGASNKIIAEAHAAEAAGEPLWIMVWGGLTDVAQALHDDPSIAGTVRILASNGSNWTRDPNSYTYVKEFAKDGMWMIDSHSTHRGIYINSSGVEGNSFNMSQVQGHGALGDYFYNARPWGVKMGDSWSIAYLTDTADNSAPGADSWGGTFKKNGLGANYYTDDPDPAYKVGTYNGAAHVREHQSQIYNDMYQHFDRAKSSNPNANADDPVAANNDSANTVMDTPITIKVLENDSAPDGGLKLASADSTTAKGGKVTINSDGTLKYAPKAGYVGDDTFKYTAKDVDGDTDIATVTVKVQSPSLPPPPSSGTDYPVVAGDDTYKLEAGGQLWVGSQYLLMNDTGNDGGLKVTGIAAKSEQGISVSWSDGNPMVYKPGSFQGTDRIAYTVADADGDSDTGHIVVTVGSGTAPPPADDPAPSSGSGAVVAQDDTYKLDAGGQLWVATRYLTWNDSGVDGKGTNGELDVTHIAATSEQGISVSWSDGNPMVYKPGSFQGTDRIAYTVADQNGDTDTGYVVVTVGTGSVTPPAPVDDAPPPTSTATNNPVIAGDDIFSTQQGKDFYFGVSTLLSNDKGADGGLKVLAIDAMSKYGADVTMSAKGSIVYDPSDWFRGTDSVAYKVVDSDGSLDIGTVFFHVA